MMHAMQIQLPPDAQPGQQLQVQSPFGPMSVIVPPGAVGGALLTISVPSTPAQPVSTASLHSRLPQHVHAAASESTAGRFPRAEHTTPLLQAAEPPGGAVPMGLPVSSVMPALPDPASLSDKYSSFTYTTDEPSEAGAHHGATYDPSGGIADAAAVPVGVPVAFYTPEQLAVLNQQPAPPDLFSAGVKQCGAPRPDQELLPMGLPVARDAGAAMAHPVLTTAAGMPVVNPSVAGLSAAATVFDGWSGIKSCDARLQSSVDELLLFFSTHNSRPLVGCEVHGWHHETRHRQVRHTDQDGKEHWRTETHVVTVDDFKYKVDLTSFVYPFGFIASVDENQLTVPQLCAKFVRDRNLLKSLAMKKEVQFDFGALHAMVYGYVRSLGWRRGLTVSFPKANASVRVYSENVLSSCWENACCNCICHLTILPCIFMRIYRGDCCCSEDHAEVRLRARPHAASSTRDRTQLPQGGRPVAAPRRALPRNPRAGAGGHPVVLPHRLRRCPDIRGDPASALVPRLFWRRPRNGDASRRVLVTQRCLASACSLCDSRTLCVFLYGAVAHRAAGRGVTLECGAMNARRVAGAGVVCRSHTPTDEYEYPYEYERKNKEVVRMHEIQFLLSDQRPPFLVRLFLHPHTHDPPLMPPKGRNLKPPKPSGSAGGAKPKRQAPRQEGQDSRTSTTRQRPPNSSSRTPSPRLVADADAGLLSDALARAATAEAELAQVSALREAADRRAELTAQVAAEELRHVRERLVAAELECERLRAAHVEGRAAASRAQTDEALAHGSIAGRCRPASADVLEQATPTLTPTDDDGWPVYSLELSADAECNVTLQISEVG